MSLKDKASKINFGALPGVARPVDAGSAPVPVPAHRPKTAPGMLMAHATDQRSELLRENEALKSQVGQLTGDAVRARELQEELKAWDGAKATKLIDPALIERSRWANRDLRHFASPAFAELKAEIEASGGNVQPIKVRPLAVSSDGVQRYELVYGHRRHQACFELKVPVLALVDNLGDTALFVEMDRENRARKDLSAWEQGSMYRRALDEGLFPSSRKLAEAVGADLTNVGRALALAALPDEVVAAFESPLDLQFRWARPLAAAIEGDAAKVRSLAAELSRLNPRPKAKDVFERLTVGTGQGGSTVLPPQVVPVEADGTRVATITLDAGGVTSVTIKSGLVTEERLPELAGLLEKFLGSPPRRTR